MCLVIFRVAAVKVIDIISETVLDIVEMLAKTDNGQALEMLEETGLTDALRSLQNATIFLPSPEAQVCSKLALGVRCSTAIIS